MIYAKRKIMDGIFSFNATDPGQYSFVFSNMKQKKDKRVTFAIQKEDKEHKIIALANQLSDEELDTLLAS